MSLVFTVKSKESQKDKKNANAANAKKSDNGNSTLVDKLNAVAAYKSSPGISTTFGIPFYRSGDSKVIDKGPLYKCGCSKLDPKTGDLLRNKNTGIPYEKPLRCTKHYCDGLLSCRYCHH
jgi:hypothetical protein